MSDNEHEDEFNINPEDIVQIIDLADNAGDVERNGDEADDSSADSGNEDDDNDEMDIEDAAIVPISDDSVLTFGGHKDSSVICSRLSPVDHQIAVTGGQDDRALVWNTLDGSVLFQCTGHTDTVASVGFSHDGSLVGTADMKGLIKVWRLDTGKEVWSFDVSEIEWIQWHNAAPVLLAGTKEGQVWMWKIPSGECKTFAGHGPSATCGKILPDGKSVCIGYEDGVVKIWDLKNAAAVHTISGHEGHQSAVYCLDTKSNGSLVLTGSGDMTAKVINTITGKVVATLKCHGSEEEEDSVEAVAFSYTHDYAVTGTLGGCLEIWDLPSKSVRHRCEHPYGVVKLMWSPTSPIFYTACLDGNVRQYDSRSGQLIKVWQGHVAALLDFDLARNEDIVLTASDDSTAKVFSLKDSPS